jgi:hypothetical protein
LLKCFSRTEIREFGKFVCSPFHNNRKIVAIFYDVLKEYYPDFDSVSGEVIYRKVFPGKKFNQNELVRLSSYLFKLGRDYLAVSWGREGSFYFEKQLLESLDDHNADFFFEKEFENVQKTLNSYKMNNQYFLLKVMMELMKINFKLKKNKQKDICENVIKNIEYGIFQLIIDLTIRYGDMLTNKSRYNYNFNNTTAELFIENFNFDRFIKNLKIEETRYYNYILYYYYHFKAYTNSGNKYYKMMVEYTFRDYEKLTEQERVNRYIGLFSYCIEMISRGNLKFVRNCFEFHKEAFENKLFKGHLTTDFIYPVFFRNFVIYGIAAKEYDYIENFVAQNGIRLQEEYRNDMVNVSNAMLQFEKKGYAKAIELLSKVKFSYPKSQMDTKSIYIKTFYETDDYESLFTSIDSFKHYLKRDETIRDVIREQMLSFLSYTNKLAKQKLKNTEEIYRLQKIIKQDLKVDPIQKIWLIEKTEELLHNFKKNLGR